ncbi:hypothetical protein BG000_006896, partial [Podila horticola]
MNQSSIPVAILESLRPDTFNGRYRDSCAEDWLARFERYCNVAKIADTGQDRILFASLLLTEVASRWFDQLGTITDAMIDGKRLSPYQVFKYRFRQRFFNANDVPFPGIKY